MSTFLPDVNVLFALSLRNHVHTTAAQQWYEQEQRPALQVCGLTQIALLRFLTTESAAGIEVLSNDGAWKLYLGLVAHRNVVFCQEPNGLEEALGRFGSFGKPAPKLWADAYLVAFAATAGLKLVTFDRALARRAPRSILLCD